MKFLLIASFSKSIVSFRGELIKSLIERGISVTVAAPGLVADTSTRQALREIGAKAIEFPLQRTGTNPARDIGSLWHLYRLMRSARPDVVLAYTIKPVIYGSLAAWLARVPRRYALITGLGNALEDTRSGPLASIVARLYRLALARVNKVFFQNPDDQALLRDKGILPEGIASVVVNGSGIELSEYDLRPVTSGPASFLMIARLLGGKGVREYVSAAKQVRALYPDARFRLAGWIDDNPDAISQAELDEWVEQGHVEFLGRLADVRPAIADCSVYVLPSKYGEGTPRTVLEAMAMGRAIITTDAPGCREAVVHDQNGFLVPVESVERLADTMCRFVEDHDLAARMGLHSREIAEAKYDVHKVNAVMRHEMGI